MPVIGKRTESDPYTALAAGYDMVMAHVDYEYWASYVHSLFLLHHPDLESILELGCGTGSLALSLQPLGPYRYTATDGSAAMIRVARQKARQARRPVRFEVLDFTSFQREEPVDAVVLLYDGLNYVLDKKHVEALFRDAYRALRPGGVFLFDQSTPANSINNADFFEDKGHTDGFSYVRRSRYDPDSALHTTTFILTVDDKNYREQHVQRAYDINEIRALVRGTAFEEVAAYDDFSVDTATEEAERIHWVLRRPVD